MHDVIRGMWRRLGIAAVHENRGAAGGPAGFNIACAIPHHEAVLELDAQFACQLQKHPGFGFAARATVGSAVKAGLDGIQTQFAVHDFVHRLHFRTGHQAVCHVGLVGHDCQEKPRALQPLQARGGFRINPEVGQAPRGVAAPVADFGNNDHPIPIEKYRRYQPCRRAYHFVGLRCKDGRRDDSAQNTCELFRIHLWYPRPTPST